MEEIVQKLNLPFEGEMHNNSYIVILDNSDDFSKLYNNISTRGEFTLDDRSMSTSDNAVFIFYNDDCEIQFTADFKQDIYRMTVDRR